MSGVADTDSEIINICYYIIQKLKYFELLYYLNSKLFKSSKLHLIHKQCSQIKIKYPNYPI